jgi:hypothetical protein
MCIFCGGGCGGLGEVLMPVLLTLAIILPGEIKNKIKAWAEKKQELQSLWE